MRLVLKRVQDGHAAGYKMVVALSAMSGVTNHLLAQAKEFSACPDPAEMDVLVTTGEQARWRFSLCWTRTRASRPVPARVPDSHHHQFPFQPGTYHGHRRAHIKSLLEDYDVLVVAGFQGVDCDGRLTTLAGAVRIPRAGPGCGLASRPLRDLHRRQRLYTTDPICAARPQDGTHLLRRDAGIFESGARSCRFVPSSSPRNTMYRSGSAPPLPTTPEPWSPGG
jgi:aspartate kinase